MKRTLLTERIDVFIIRPSKRHKTFQIIKRVRPPTGGKPVSESIKSDELSLINSRFLSGKEALDDALRQVKALAVRLKEQSTHHIPKSTANSGNLRKLDEVWQERFDHREYANAESKKAAYGDFRRAVEALGDCDILTAADDEIERQVSKLFSGKKKKRLLSDISTLSKHLGRKEPRKFAKIRIPRQKPPHLTYDELEKVIADFSQEQKLFYRALFFTGCRLGELEALGPSSFRGKMVHIDSQIDRHRQITEPKWGSIGDAFVPPEGRDIVKQWCELEAEIKKRLRTMKHSNFLSAKCAQTFPNDPVKLCSVHDLRHSYAIHCLNKGLTLDIVSRSLREKYKTCEEYYQGFMLQASSVEAAEAMYKKK